MIRSTILALILLSAFVKEINGQVVFGKLGISAEIHTGWYHGNEFISQGNPSLYSYMSPSAGGTLEGVFYFNDMVGAGINGRMYYTEKELFTEAFQETEPDDSPYRGSNLKVRSLSPFIQLRFAPRMVHIDRSAAYFQLGGGIGQSLFNYRLEDDASTDLFWGFHGKLGYEWPISQTLWLVGSITYHYQLIDATLYPDNRFSGTHIGLGVRLNLFKNKRYIYD